MRILDAAAMQEVDRRAIDELGVPGMVLMENAAIGVVDALGTRFADAERISILCGPGNNGGDGLAIARHLHGRGYSVEIFLLSKSRPSGDAGRQLAILEAIGLPIRRIDRSADLRSFAGITGSCDLLVDALFGTGLRRPLKGLPASAVECVAGLCPVLAVDLPSGLDASRCAPIGPHLPADLTVTFGALKIAHVFLPAAESVGEVVVTDLGIPGRLVEEAAGDLELLGREEVALELPVRPLDGHKGRFGHVLVVGGSVGMSGASVLAARAAVRSGAGLVTVAVPRELQVSVDLASLESLTLAFPGVGDSLGENAVDWLLEESAKRDVVAIGPGLGCSDETAAAVRAFVARCPKPVVVDADGLNALAGRLDSLRRRPAATILTPHPGEMARLLDGGSAETVQADRLSSVRRACEASATVVVLKGYRSLVAVPGEGVAVCPTGNPGMATGGSGDVLTGLIAGLLAQLGSPGRAARLGVYLHGLAGDRAAAELGGTGYAAGDLVDRLAAARAELASA